MIARDLELGDIQPPPSQVAHLLVTMRPQLLERCLDRFRADRYLHRELHTEEDDSGQGMLVLDDTKAGREAGERAIAVRDLTTGRIEITSQNHNFAVADGTIASADVTHVNLNDGVVEGIACRDVPAFSVQYHPEAGPGPHDAAYLFDEFAALIDATRSR